jgi:hypothetical protein
MEYCWPNDCIFVFNYLQNYDFLTETNIGFFNPIILKLQR